MGIATQDAGADVREQLPDDWLSAEEAGEVDRFDDAGRSTPSVSSNAFAGLIAAESLSRRVRALACTAPLHALEANKVRVADGRWAGLNCWELAFVAIDAVAIAMDFDTGASYEATVELVARQAARQEPALSRADSAAAGAWIVEGLISGRGGDEPFHAAYGKWDEGLPYEARGFHVELLTEHPGPDGSIYLRASDQAINVLIGALDTDIESAAEAVDAKMESLVRRGMWNEAVLTAEHARYRSIQYAEMIRREVIATRQNVMEVDWVERVPALIDRSLDHVVRRYRTERIIIGNVTRSRDEATEPSLRAKASQMLTLLTDCQSRHEALQRKLLGAREEFREATREQLARPAPTVSLVDLERQVLVPLLEAVLRDATRPVERFFTRLSAPTALVGDVDRLVAILCQPPRDGHDEDAELNDPELTDVRREPRFDDRTWAEAESVLATCDRPTRLSSLLARAEDADVPGDVEHLVALLAVRAVDPGLGHWASTPGDRVLLAADDGTLLSHPRFAGSDLLLIPAHARPADEGSAMSGKVGP
jgi:hypothetical protein